jgi:hypothetical protein
MADVEAGVDGRDDLRTADAVHVGDGGRAAGPGAG